MSSVVDEGESPPGLPAPNRSLRFPRSFRGLVTAWNTVTILLFTVTMLAGLRYGLSYTLLHEEDRLLADDATEVGLLIERAPRWGIVQAVLDRKANSHADRKWFGEVRDSAGTTLARSESVPDIPFAFPRADAPQALTLGSYRALQRRYQVGGSAFVILVGSSTEGIDEDVVRLTNLILIAGVALLIFAPLGGFWLAGRVIRPLANIIERTASLRPGNLHERLPIRHTGDELDRLSMTINDLLDRIAHYLARHRDLTANAAHELRSPLTAMLSSAEVALNQDRTTEEYKDLLGSIVEECTRLGTLVQQLLLLAESDAGRLERKAERVPLDQLARRAAEMFEGVAESKGVSLEIQAPQPVWVAGDAGMVRQVIFNLIDNALKFTPAGSVRVEVKADAEGAGQLAVTDTGVGIPPESLPYVFDRFYRGDHARTRLATGGSGLGLSICKALVTANGGAIAITSEVSRGTRVQVTLPRAV